MERGKMGQRLNEIRKMQGLSSDSLAELCDINSGGYIRQLEGGSKSPSVELLIKLCNALGVSPEYLLADSLNQPADGSLESDLSEKVKLLTPEQLELLTTMADKMLEQSKRM